MEISRWKELRNQELENDMELLNDYANALNDLYEKYSDKIDEVHIIKILDDIDDFRFELKFYKEEVLPYEEDELIVIVDFE